MEMLRISLDADNAWPDLKEADAPAVVQGDVQGVALMENATIQGNPTVWVRLELPDGTVVLGQITAKLFCGAAKTFLAKHPKLLD